MLSALLIAITVLTWNTGRMGEFKKPEKNEVLQYLLQQDADVVCLQEVDVYKDGHFLTLPDVKKTLSPKYPYSYLDFSVYNKRHQYGTMVWSKYPLIHKQSIHYESFGNLSNRCDIVVGKDTFRLFNNHLESYKLESEDLQDVKPIGTSVAVCTMHGVRRIRFLTMETPIPTKASVCGSIISCVPTL